MAILIGTDSDPSLKRKRREGLHFANASGSVGFGMGVRGVRFLLTLKGNRCDR